MINLQIGGNSIFFVSKNAGFGINASQMSTGRRCYAFEGSSGAATFALYRYADNLASNTSTIWKVDNTQTTDTFVFGTNGAVELGTGYLAWNAGDVRLYRGGAAATLQMGVNVNGAPVNQIFKSHNGITGTDVSSANLTIASGMGTGAGAVSSLIFQTPTVLASSTTAQTLSTRCTIDSSGLTMADAMNIVTNATTGTKLASASSQKLGLWGVTPIIQPAAAGQASITDSTGGTAASSLVDVTTTGLADPVKCNANFATINVLLLAMRTAMVNFGSMKGSA